MNEHGDLRRRQPSTAAGRALLDRLEARCEALGGCKVMGADHMDAERLLRSVEEEAAGTAVRELETLARALIDEFGIYEHNGRPGVVWPCDRDGEAHPETNAIVHALAARLRTETPD